MTPFLISGAKPQDMLFFETDENIGDHEVGGEHSVYTVELGNNRLPVLFTGNNRLRTPSTEIGTKSTGDYRGEVVGQEILRGK